MKLAGLFLLVLIFGSCIHGSSGSLLRLLPPSESNLLTNLLGSLLGLLGLLTDPCAQSGVVYCEDDPENILLKHVVGLTFDPTGTGTAVGDITGLNFLRTLDLSGALVDMNFSLLPNTVTTILGSGSSVTSLAGLSALTNLQQLVLSNNALTGPIPAIPSTLQVLDLSGNTLSGALPNLDGATGLTSVKLDGNAGLTGSISGLGGSLLTSFSAQGTGLTGALPAISSAIQVLNLAGNNFTGGLPTISGPLQVLDLSGSGLSGALQLTGSLAGLTNLNLAGNGFTGVLPTISGPLQVLDLSGNALSGALQLTGSLSGLTKLNLDGNTFGGALPNLMPSASVLTSLSVPGNQFTGSLPTGTFDALKVLNVAGNSFSGGVTLFAPLLEVVDLSSNLLGGEFGLSSTLSNLQVLNLSNNAFLGALPVFDDAGALRILDGSLNAFTGALGLAGNFPLLETLNLSGNKLLGPVPALAASTLLKVVDLHDNLLDGVIEMAGAFPVLEKLDLSHNKLVGSIPDLTGSVMLTTLDLSNNLLSGNLNLDSTLANLRVLNLAVNNLVGAIPSGLGQLVSLTALNLIGNQFTCPSVSLGGLVNLLSCALSGNSLCASPDQIYTPICPNLFPLVCRITPCNEGPLVTTPITADTTATFNLTTVTITHGFPTFTYAVQNVSNVDQVSFEFSVPEILELSLPQDSIISNLSPDVGLLSQDNITRARFDLTSSAWTQIQTKFRGSNGADCTYFKNSVVVNGASFGVNAISCEADEYLFINDRNLNVSSGGFKLVYELNDWGALALPLLSDAYGVAVILSVKSSAPTTLNADASLGDVAAWSTLAYTNNVTVAGAAGVNPHFRFLPITDVNNNQLLGKSFAAMAYNSSTDLAVAASGFTSVSIRSVFASTLSVLKSMWYDPDMNILFASTFNPPGSGGTNPDGTNPDGTNPDGDPMEFPNGFNPDGTPTSSIGPDGQAHSPNSGANGNGGNNVQSPTATPTPLSTAALGGIIGGSIAAFVIIVVVVVLVIFKSEACRARLMPYRAAVQDF